MGRQAIIFLASCLCGTSVLQAQEHPILPGIEPGFAPSALQQPVGDPVRYSSQWLSEQLNPALQKRRQIRRVMEQRAQESALTQQAGTSEITPDETSGLWKATIGNTAVQNWSPYPDRELDARTLRFPLPKRPTTQQPRK